MTTKKKQELLKDPLFICYAMVIQEWYKNPQTVTNLGNAVDVWFNDFCAAYELNPDTDFIRNAKHNLKLLFWNAMLADVSMLPNTPSYAAVEAGMSAQPDPKFFAGIEKPKKP